jgi:hypothetical protein
MQNIKDYLSYDPLTGLFTCIKKYSRCIKVGSVLKGGGNRNAKRIQFNKTRYLAHILAWYFTYGEMPKHAIDHINEDPSDNRIANLRLDINRENTQNISSLQCNNTSGFRGVYWLKLNKCWVAQIKIKGKQTYIGRFDTVEEAHAAYLCAKREHHPFWVENK